MIEADQVEESNKKRGSSKYSLNYLLVGAMQSIGAGVTAAQTIVGFLNLLGPKYINRTYYTIEALLGSAEEMMKDKSQEDALAQEKKAVLEKVDDTINGENIPLMVSFGKNN